MAVKRASIAAERSVANVRITGIASLRTIAKVAYAKQAFAWLRRAPTPCKMVTRRVPIAAALAPRLVPNS